MITQPAFDRMVQFVEDKARGLQRRVDRLGGIEAAQRRGAIPDIQIEVGEIESVCRTLKRMFGEAQS